MFRKKLLSFSSLFFIALFFGLSLSPLMAQEAPFSSAAPVPPTTPTPVPTPIPTPVPTPIPIVVNTPRPVTATASAMPVSGSTDLLLPLVIFGLGTCTFAFYKLKYKD